MSWPTMMKRTSRPSCGEWKKLRVSPLFTRPGDELIDRRVEARPERRGPYCGDGLKPAGCSSPEAADGRSARDPRCGGPTVVLREPERWNGRSTTPSPGHP